MILTWIQGNDMEPESLDGLGNMSKAEMLRVIVTEKLAAAAQEILAVVERTVAGYEEEASGFRQEIDRQRRQLEVLLQPEIKLETTDDQQLFPICEPVQAEASGGGAQVPEEEEQQHKYELSVVDARSMGLLCYTEEQMDEDEEDEDEGASERPALTSTRDREPLTEPDYETASRLAPPTVQSDRRSAGRPRTGESQSHVDLRIRILEDSQTEVLSTSVFKKYPAQDLKCPRGLREPDFLDLLRSSFPPLAADKSFDLFTTDRTRRLLPLRVKTLTPEEIYRTIKSTGHSALYIRLKTQEEPQAADEVFHPSQRQDNAAAADEAAAAAAADEAAAAAAAADEAAAAASPSTPDQTRQHTRLLTPRVQSKRRRPGRPRISDPHNYVHLRICILEDSQTDVLSAKVFKKYPVQELQCPCGLREADFLDLLTSSFPPLAADKSFDLFTTDRTRRLLPLRVKTLTPEEIYRTIRTTGHSALYIRLKPLEKLQIREKDLPLQRKEAAAKRPPSTPDQTRLDASVQADRRKRGRPRISDTQNYVALRIRILEDSQINVLSANVFKKTRRLQPLRVKTLTPEEIYRTIKSTGHSALYIRLKADRRKRGRPRISDTQNYVALRIRILEDSQINVLSANVFKKYPVQELQCPRGLREEDFLDLLRSTFPQLAADKPVDLFITDRTRRLQPLRVKTLTPEEIYRTIKSTRHSALYIRLKAQEEAQASEEKLHLPQGNKDSPSTSAQTRLHTRADVLSSSSMEAEEAHDEDGERSESASLWSLQSLLLSESERDEDEVNDRDDDWKPDKSDENLRNKEPEKTTGRRRVERSGVRTKRKRIQASPRALTSNGDAPPSCKVCGARRGSMNMVIKHSWSHVDDPERFCGVCGKHSKSAEELRSHLQSHQKTHSCNICGKSFLSTSGLSGHIARHKGEKPYKCKICHKAFAEKSVLSNHRWVHVVDKPHKCDICQKSCVSKIKLELHRARHTEEKPHSCSKRTKPLGGLETLSQHVLTHSARGAVKERPYVCEICSKKFYTNQRLQVHRRSHTSKWPNGSYSNASQTW
ncbi:uncharacterized protein LOC120797742 [Xiphias gladius]|uniref:uncharacterized protein LOC120797742 n=1 Tax=Xiphias gladius TaxID=8245 RepID=UPI001A9969A4|nr:uncharacterized protein LOC120797742 [Xiphias gladius]